MGEHGGQGADGVEAGGRRAAAVQHSGAQHVEGQRRQGEEDQGGPDVGVQHPNPAPGPVQPAGVAAVGADVARPALFDAPIGVGRRLAGVDAGVAVHRQGEHRELQGKVEAQPGSHVGQAHRVVGKLHRDGADQGDDCKAHHQGDHRALKAQVGAGAQHGHDGQGDDGRVGDWVEADQQLQPLAGAADDAAHGE